MEELEFEHTYDLIWIQWVIGHLIDEDLINFLVKCKKHLSPSGVIFVKDNLSKKIFIFEKNDYHIVKKVEK